MWRGFVKFLWATEIEIHSATPGCYEDEKKWDECQKKLSEPPISSLPYSSFSSLSGSAILMGGGTDGPSFALFLPFWSISYLGWEWMVPRATCLISWQRRGETWQPWERGLIGSFSQQLALFKSSCWNNASFLGKSDWGRSLQELQLW